MSDLRELAERIAASKFDSGLDGWWAGRVKPLLDTIATLPLCEFHGGPAADHDIENCVRCENAALRTENERLRAERDDLQGVVDELVDRIQKGPALSPVPEPTEVKR